MKHFFFYIYNRHQALKQQHVTYYVHVYHLKLELV